MERTIDPSGRIGFRSCDERPRLGCEHGGGCVELASKVEKLHPLPIFSKIFIGLFAVSAFNTDYILVKEENLEKAFDALRGAGCTVIEK